MVKYIYFAAFSDYWKIANADLYKCDEVHVCEGTSRRILDKLCYAHNSWKLNKKRELPFKSVWFGRFTCSEYLNPDEKQIIVFPEANSVSFSAKYLKYLRKKYPKLVTVFNFSNPCSEYNLKKLDRVKEYYDHIVTFNRADSERFGLEFLPIDGYSKIDLPESDIPESDLFFVGKDKGRLQTLLAIHDKMTAIGLKCDFSVVCVDPRDTVPREGVTYNRRMTYGEVLQHAEKTKCILELLEGGSDYSSIRTTEALTYGKKLITMSPCVKDSPYYSPTQMLCIRSADDITREFFDKPIENDYDIADFSPIKRLEEVGRLERTKP